MSAAVRIFSLVCCGWIAAVPAAALQATDYATENSGLVCRVVGRDGKPLRGVRVLAYHLSSERLYATEPTRGKGRSSLERLPYGYLDLAVETADGLYVATEAINVPPHTTSSVVLTLLGSGLTEPGLRSYPGTGADPVGLARLDERLRGRAFWKSPRGIAIIAGAAGLLLLLLAGGGSDDGGSTSNDVAPRTLDTAPSASENASPGDPGAP